MMAQIKKRYALTDDGARNIALGALWTAVTNLVTMGGIVALFLCMDGFVNALVEGSSAPDIAPFALGLAAFAVALFAVNWLQYTYTYGVVYAESGRQRIGLAERLRKLPLGFFGQRDVADLTETMLGDVTVMEHAYSHVLGELYGAVASTAIVFIGMLAFDWQLALAAFWSVPVAFALLFATRPLLNPLFKRTRAANVAVSGKVQETLDCMREIRATNQEARFLSGLDAKIDEAERTMTRGEVTNGTIVNISFVILRLGIPTTLLVGASLVAQGSIGFMTMFAFLLVVSRIYAPFDQCLMLISELFASRASAERMNAIMAEPLMEGTGGFAPRGHDVKFDQVEFSYGGAEVLKGASFKAREGEVTAIVGPSGSGKSTCAKLAARFWDAREGSVRIGGADVKAADPEELLSLFSVVFQDVVLFDGTVLDNVLVGRKGASRDEALAAARAAGLEEVVARMPQGWSANIGENGARLSGGERQRVSIARAILKDAPIVLLDEATASLDAEGEAQVQEALGRLLEGKTVIVVAHRMRTVMGADKVVVLEEGRVIEQGTPAELLAANGRFARMAALQTDSAGWRL